MYRDLKWFPAVEVANGIVHKAYTGSDIDGRTACNEAWCFLPNTGGTRIHVRVVLNAENNEVTCLRCIATE